MKTLKERIADISGSLQSLMKPDIFPRIQDAVDKKDKSLLIEVCRNAKIPEACIGATVSVLLAVDPQQKWPAGI